MSEWKEYTGAPEQIDEMITAAHGFICKNEETESGILTIKYGQLFSSMSHYPILNAMWDGSLKRFMDNNNTTNYLTCNPHPLADMICQQASTGQEVWVLEPIVVSNPKPEIDFSIHETYSNKGQVVVRKDGYWLEYTTDTPNWYIPGAQYSFTRVGV